MIFDVVVIGYGPVGMIATALLARGGHSVAVVERYDSLYSQPRAATFDHETARVLQKVGAIDAVLPSCVPQTTYDWCNAAGEVLINFELKARGPMSWAETYLMYQPALEDALDTVVRTVPSAEVHQGLLAIDLLEEQDHVGVVVEDTATCQRGELRGRFVLACDGGNSFARSRLGIECDDYGFRKDWLVVDLEIKRPVDLPLSRQLCDPQQPGVMLQLGSSHRRWSFMILPGESIEDALDVDNVWRRLSRWITPDDMDLVRVASYTFQSLVAQQWRAGRTFLLGDAAHQMPPFLGQGMCSGVRDANNLAWKLDLVIRGAAPLTLLDTYQIERQPHVQAITAKAIELGRIQTLLDPQQAARRDADMLSARAARQARQGSSGDSLVYEGLTAGLLGRRSNGSLHCAAGDLFVQGRISISERSGLFDDVAGSGLVIIGYGIDPLAALTPEQASLWAQLGGLTAAVDSEIDDDSSTLSFEDDDGTYRAWFEAHGCVAVVARPDFYVYAGAAAASELPDIVGDLLAGMGASPTRPPVRPASVPTASRSPSTPASVVRRDGWRRTSP